MAKATITNGVIVQDKGNSIVFKPECPKCGTLQSSTGSNMPGGSRGYLCPKCGTRFDTITRWV